MMTRSFWCQSHMKITKFYLMPLVKTRLYVADKYQRSMPINHCIVVTICESLLFKIFKWTISTTEAFATAQDPAVATKSIRGGSSLENGRETFGIEFFFFLSEVWLFPVNSLDQSTEKLWMCQNIKMHTWTWFLLRRMRCNFGALLLLCPLGTHTQVLFRILGPKYFFFRAMDRARQAAP